MSFLSSLIPTNLQEEKAKFFSDQTYNPQFIYGEPIDEKKLNKYGKPTKKHQEIAKNILEKAYFGRNEAQLLDMRGPLVPQKEVERAIHTFLKMHGLEKKIRLILSSSFTTRTSITPDAIKVRLPTNFRKEDLFGMLYHEIGTHAIRYINYEKQPFFEKKKKYGFSDYLLTEEGLAALHSLLPRSFKSAYIPALQYITIAKANGSSFRETYDMLQQYVQDPERRWRMTFRQKRGLEDTNKPGGYSKDLVYFEGLLAVSDWLKKNNFDSTDLYLGKIALEDIEKAKMLNPKFIPTLPTFLSLSKEKYALEMKRIGDYNEL